MRKPVALKGLMDSEAEWGLRDEVLADSLAALLERFRPVNATRGLDVGCQHGDLTDDMARRTGFTWSGVDPAIMIPRQSPDGAELVGGTADHLPYEDGHFDCAIFANVYEHISPEHRLASLAEIRRVLAPGGVVVGQLPNPYFPIESHSRLPFMGWLPVSLQHRYWRLSPAPWDHDFFVVTIRHLRRTAVQAGFEVVLTRNFNYPPEVIPEAVRWAARLLERPMRHVPWAWQFVLRRA